MKTVKVCGLTRPEDVALAAALGAGLTGFVLAPSPRSVSVDQLKLLVTHAPASVLTVAVVVNPSVEECDRLLGIVDRIQFHGDESPDFCARYGRRGIKAFRIRAVVDLERVEEYRGSVGAYLLDSFKEGLAGGTGETFCWEYLRGKEFSLPTFLAGGLNPTNATEAHKLPQITGVDVSSGLEQAPGIKDSELMREFFVNFRGTEMSERHLSSPG